MATRRDLLGIEAYSVAWDVPLHKGDEPREVFKWQKEENHRPCIGESVTCWKDVIDKRTAVHHGFRCRLGVGPIESSSRVLVAFIIPKTKRRRNVLLLFTELSKHHLDDNDC